MKIIGDFLMTVAWSIYLGGALIMELVWRPVQQIVPPSQTGVLCLRMGKKYKWMALAALILIAASQIIMVPHGEFSTRFASVPIIANLNHPQLQNWQRYFLSLGWVLLVAVVLGMGTLIHPLSHTKLPVIASESERLQFRKKRLSLIAMMNRMLRFELFAALLITLIVVVPYA